MIAAIAGATLPKAATAQVRQNTGVTLPRSVSVVGEPPSGTGRKPRTWVLASVVELLRRLF